jgi:transcriptional regulator with XRE-family HTH domain|tara:strand:- start:720 stop:977 length:258 start_codon:yes stop_codon:yes gene_type:complete
MKDFRYKHHLSYPEDGDPIIGKIIELTNKSKMSSSQVCKKAGISINAITGWKASHGVGQRNPSLRKVQAVLDALGYKLVVRKGDL